MSLPAGPRPDLFAYRAAAVRMQAEREQGQRQLWHAHHWPDDYAERCVRIGRRHWCRRCLALYPLGFLVAVLSVAGLAPWPPGADPAAIWLLCLPATVAFVGEATGLVTYRARWQTAVTLVAAVAFGRALGYELEDRWHPWFWQPVAVFGGIWFLASVFQHRVRPRLAAEIDPGRNGDRDRGRESDRDSRDGLARRRPADQ